MYINISKLKMLRLSNGLTKAKMARKIGVAHSVYNRIESGESIGSIKTFAKIQQAFELSNAEIWQIICEQLNGVDN